jgi:hypothetical protein
MTEKQEKIKEKLLKLIQNDKSSKHLLVSFHMMDRRENDILPSRAFREGDRVNIVLIDPGIDEYKLSEWDAAIEQAARLLQLIDEEKKHEANNPNFFKAIMAITNDAGL